MAGPKLAAMRAPRWPAALALLAAALTHAARGEGGSGGGSGGSGGSGKMPTPAPTNATHPASEKLEPAAAVAGAVGLAENAPPDSGGSGDDEGLGGSAEAADEGGSGGSGGSGEAAGDDSDLNFCNGMPTAMYMEGFVSVFGSSRAKRHCAVFLSGALVLDTPGKFFLGLLGAAGFGALTELAMAMKRREEQRAKPEALNQALWHACTLTLGYCDMLLVMVYSLELAAAVVAGLVLGRACTSHVWPPQAIAESEDSMDGIGTQMSDPLYSSTRKRNGCCGMTCPLTRGDTPTQITHVLGDRVVWLMDW
ncbi:unnamed protein product [Prorocentrum cordatum]|uniref:Copper transport protein n=1 Tax=Prorocentrum cordatum TaxID=2364126 RepID=A0ABN9QRP1_9DINO|nr:unnamed protein product [Polarella glacialis]